MFSKKRFLGIIIFVIIFSLTSCSKKEISVSELLEKAKDANNKVETIKINNEITQIDTEDNKNIQHLFGDLQYDLNSKKVEKSQISIKYEGDLKDNQKDMEYLFLGDEKKTLIEKSPDNSIKNEYYGENFVIKPDYFKLLNSIYSMDKDLLLKESSEDYVLTLNSQNIDILSLFGENFNLKFTGVTQNELDKQIEITFDKKTFLLKKFYFLIKYEGEKGKFNIENNTVYSDWNNVTVNVENK